MSAIGRMEGLRMLNFLSKVKDNNFVNLIDSVPLGDSEEFKKVVERFPTYDPSFLWLICYAKEGQPRNRKYIEAGYRKYSKILDHNFPQIMASRGNFWSRMWELILCDILSASGELQPKKAAGADFILKSSKGLVQIEAVVPGESNDKDMRAIRPDYSTSHSFEYGGPIHELERPIVLRVLQAFNDKRDGYDKHLPLILAINSHKAVRMTSDDTYILRRVLFGLGNRTLNCEGQWGFEQLPYYNKPGESPFLVSYFRRPEFSHISGVIYSSQNPLGFIPGGYSWHNSGIEFVPNPMATYPIKFDFPYFRRIVCDETRYREEEPQRTFESTISLD